ncbi:MAG TPA: zinc ribbon domain-containing protein [Casimicrobiaceae bacterium]|nr:zinc ribbon domain-containing protein [Casimicrobiaceae bacterium]
MPIYEYRCSACGHELEALQKLRDAPLTDCPSCGQSELRKQVSAAGFQLKGSGWYVTDFRNSGAKKSGKDKASDKDAAKGNGGSDTSADSAKSGDGAKAESKSSESSATTTSATESKSSTTTASKSDS